METPNSRPQRATTETTTRTVRANDLNQALARVRMTYGRDALVLGTKTVTVPDPASLRPRTQVEVTVADPNATVAEEVKPAATPWAQAYAEAAGSSTAVETAPSPLAPEEQALDARVDRLDSITHRVRDLTSRLDRIGDDAIDYPLEAALRAQGTSEATIDHLSGSFRLAVKGGDANETAARRHLSRFVRGTRAVEVSHLRGEHWFLGRAGSGKTTLTLFLAGALRAAGVEVAIAAVSPNHAGDVQRLQSAARALDVPLHVVHDEAQMQAVRSESRGTEAMLVDTPCFVGKELPVLPPEEAQRHVVVPLGEDREHLRAHLDHVTGWQADCLALTQMDLYPRPGRLVDLAVESGRPISLLQGRREGAIRVAVARGEALMTAVLGEHGVALAR